MSNVTFSEEVTWPLGISKELPDDKAVFVQDGVVVGQIINIGKDDKDDKKNDE